VLSQDFAPSESGVVAKGMRAVVKTHRAWDKDSCDPDRPVTIEVSSTRDRCGSSPPAASMMPPSNQSLQPTAGRSDASLHFMKTRPLQATLALANGG